MVYFGILVTDVNPCDLFERTDSQVDELFTPDRGGFLYLGQDEISEPKDGSDCECQRR